MEETNTINGQNELLFQHPAASSPLTIVASYRQRGNPLLEHLKELRVEYANIVSDYLFSPTSAALFISLKYYRLHPDYLAARIESLKKSFRVRLLLCLVDLPDYELSLEAVTELAFRGSMTLCIAWSPSEGGKLLQTFKLVGDKPPDSIQGRLETGVNERIINILTTIPTINKVDCSTLMREFGTFKKLLEASKEDLAKCPGIGEKKVNHLWKVFHEPLRHST